MHEDSVGEIIIRHSFLSDIIWGGGQKPSLFELAIYISFFILISREINELTNKTKSFFFFNINKFIHYL